MKQWWFFWPCLRTATVNGVCPTFLHHFWGTYIDKLPVVFFKYRHSNENACGFNNRLYIVTSGTAIDRVYRSCFKTYWFSSILHSDVATVCQNRVIYTDFVKASSSFCSSRLNQLFKFILCDLEVVKMVFNMSVWKIKLLMVVFNCISISGWLSVKHTSTLVNSGSRLSRTIQR